MSLFIDAWRIAPGAPLGVTPIDRRTCRRLLDALRVDEAADLEAARAELRSLLPEPCPIDPRVSYALGHLTEFERLADLASEVGLSSVRLRTLVQNTVGIPMARLRNWARLRAAMCSLDKGLALASQRGGFSDQAHFTRIARQLLGRTPGSLL